MNVQEQYISNDRGQTEESVTISAICEKLSVEKRLVETGAIRVRKLIHEDHTTVDVPLTAEIAHINRVKMGTVVTGPVPVRYEGLVTIVPVVEERLVTYTELVLVEEIHITRHRTEQLTRQEATTRREEIVIERLDASSGEWRIVQDDASIHGL